MTALIKIDAYKRKFSFLKDLNIEMEKKDFVTEMYLMTEGIFLSQPRMGENSPRIILCYNSTFRYCEALKTVEDEIVTLLKEGKKVTHIVRYTSMNLELFLLPEGYGSAADLMIPLLNELREKAMVDLERRIARLYSKKEEQPTGNPGVNLGKSLNEMVLK